MNHVLIEKNENEIAHIVLNRPDTRNTLNIELLKALLIAIQEVKKDPSIRILIIKSNAPIFGSGLDTQESLNDLTSMPLSVLLADVLKEIYYCPFATIAVVNAGAIAGGAAIMSACDFAIADENSKFAFPEVKKGLTAALVMAVLKPKLHERHLRELLLLGEFISAEKALSMGLINKIVKSEQLTEEAMNIAAILLKNGPKAIEKSKEFIDGLTGNFNEDLNRGVVEGQKVRSSKEAKEGLQASLDGRSPSWIHI